jgi:hypothetical protein
LRAALPFFQLAIKKSNIFHTFAALCQRRDDLIEGIENQQKTPF